MGHRRCWGPPKVKLRVDDKPSHRVRTVVAEGADRRSADQEGVADLRLFTKHGGQRAGVGEVSITIGSVWLSYHHVTLLERPARELELAEEGGEDDAGEEEGTGQRNDKKVQAHVLELRH